VSADRDDPDPGELYDTVDAGISREDLEDAQDLAEALEIREVDLSDKVGQVDRDYDPDEVVDRIEKEHRPSRVGLPGFGDRYESCGMEIPHACEECGHPVEIGRTCKRSRCPRCAPAWVLDRAPPIVNNVQGAARMMSAQLDQPVYKHHLILSPPEGILPDHKRSDVNGDTPEKVLIREAIYEFMEAIGMQGHVFYHPWAGDHDVSGDDSRLENSFKAQHEDDRGEWSKRVFRSRDWHGDVREELEHRPHFHVIGACPWVPGGDVIAELYERTGWIMHRITGRNGSSVSLGSLDQIARAVVYCLSHTAIDTRGETNNYVFGRRGSAFINADDRDMLNAKRSCYSQFPELFGFSMDISCSNAVEDDPDDHDTTPDELEELETTDSDPDSDSTTLNMRTCFGDFVRIDRAIDEFLRSAEWQAHAEHAEEALEVARDWERMGGWEGWIEQQTGQARLPTDVEAQLDTPPD